MAKGKKQRRKMKKERYDQSYDSKDKGGVSQQKWLKDDKFPGSPKMFKPKVGINKMNIIPYEIKTKNHPLVKDGTLEIGDIDYLIDIWAHTNVPKFPGPDVICMQKTYGKPCKVCEERKRLYDQGLTKEADALKASRRVAYNVQPIIKGEPQEMQVLMISHYLFEKELIDEARECSEGRDIIDFADIENGNVVKFRGTEEDFQGRKTLRFISFSFLEREEELDDELIDEAVSFD